MLGLTPSDSETASIELRPNEYLKPLDLDALFGRQAPLEVDIGCGDGSFLAATAEKTPERNFLGIERLPGRVRSAARKIAHRDLRYARFLRLESSYAIRHLLPPESVTIFHLLFPDPWPKRRHHRRRIVTAGFLDSIHRALVPHGTLRVVTDQSDYFEKIQLLSQQADGFETASHDSDFAVSTFEEHYRAAGAQIYRLLLRKISDVR